MWFSPLKGAHLTLGQLDKTLPVDKSVAANMKIERGSFVYINAFDGTSKISPRFALYTAAQAAKPNAVPYIALMGINDFQAGMAGNIGQAPETDGIDKEYTAATGANLTFINRDGVASNPTYFGEQAGIEGPRITGISLLQPAEYQTTAFDKAQKDAYYVGQPLTIADGKLAPYDASNPTNIVGYVTAVPFVRWINDLGASKDGARISGGNAMVIEFSTAWIPVAATSGDNGNVKPLQVGKPATATASDVKAPAPAAPAADAPKAPAAPAAPAADAPKAPAAPAAPANKPQGK